MARTGLPWDPILDGDKDDESYNDFVFEHNNICGVFGNSFLASAAVVKHMHSKGVFNALRAVQLKYHTCMVELYFGYFGARELGCNACDVSLDGDMHEFEWTKNIHKVCVCVCECECECVRARVGKGRLGRILGGQVSSLGAPNCLCNH